VTLEIAIIADDLTGALDTAAPFTATGYSVAVATRPDAFAAALAADAEVVVVNTATRGLPPVAAASVAGQVARRLKAGRPSLVFKKIDSRLKGNAGAETAAIAEALGFAAICIAPAVPEQGRVTRGGAVVGRGVDAPIGIAPLFAPLPVTIEEAESDADLDRIVAQTDWSKTLAVGARGLGAAFARQRGRTPAEPFASERQSLFVIGSRDTITAQQIAALRGVDVHDAPGGKFTGPIVLPACIRCVGPDEDADAVAHRLAESAVRAIAAAHPKVLVLSGGDTALAVLDQLGVGLIRPRGEAAGGLPWFTIDRPDTGPLAVVVKSGGFGDSNCLAALLPPANK
jgi:uncharacterized protein YgbK (DUF1537 family)